MVVAYQKIHMVDDEDEGFTTVDERIVTVENPQELINQMQDFVTAHPNAVFEEDNDQVCLVSWQSDRVAEYLDIRCEQ